ncbi:S24 family peptidase [Alicycliphilus denitrificans]|uniref:S24 family peptidase n=1 Tax=Alicycliphilus denitrificans TaxID=179636 RepID=UPI003B75BEA3
MVRGGGGCFTGRLEPHIGGQDGVAGALQIYALWYDGGERVKRLYRLPGGVLRIQSDNTKYPEIEVQPSEMEHIRIIGRIVHVAGEGGL